MNSSKDLRTNLRSILDKHVPEKTKRIMLRKKKLWYSEDLKEQMHSMKVREEMEMIQT